MKIFLECYWGESGKNPEKFFRFPECWSLLSLYFGRIKERNFDCQISPGQLNRRPRSQLWLCHPRGKQINSVQVSEHLQRAMSSGQDLVVAIGSEQGFSEDQISKLGPDLLWSFGPLTFPHELAAVVASEQLYRGISILRHEPYHRE